MRLIRYILLLFLLSLSLFSRDLTQIYLSGEQEKLEEAFEKKLVSREYWESELKLSDYRFGYYQNPKTILVACKACYRFKHFEIDSKEVKKLNDFNASFGKVDGDKFVEGDLKTPVGVYEFTEKIKGEKLDQYYGPVAFVTDYPNTFDKARNKNGYGIWLHGFPLNGNRDELMTKGCIALENDCLEIIEENIDYKSSLVIINEKKETMSSKGEIVDILVALFQWREAWKSKNYEKYITFYSKNFQRVDGLRYNKFSNLKGRIFKKSRNIEIFIKNLEITPYPNSIEKRIFRIKFDEKYSSNIHRFDGEKELFVEITDEGFKIILER